MATGSPLPPQAYTREILTAAFNWLQTQPDSVRRQATNPDTLVGLYMRAQRLGEAGDSDAPISSQNFMSDLKNLAEGLKQFETPPSRDHHHRRQGSSGAGAYQPNSAPPPSAGHSMPSAAFSHSNSGPNTNPASGHSHPHSDAAASQFSSHGVPKSGLNERTLAMIQDVRNQLNLSSDTEAINMMVSLAYKTLRNLLA